MAGPEGNSEFELFPESLNVSRDEVERDIEIHALLYSKTKQKQNRPFPSSLVPLFQNESKCETILMKMTLICMKKKLRAELIFI